MSRVRFPFRSTPSTQQVPTITPLTENQKKEAASDKYWDVVHSEDFRHGKGKEVERLWGLENFGNTCYCNSVLQALYHCPPFRQFVESYPDIPAPMSPLGPPPGTANQPLPPTSKDSAALSPSGAPGSPLAVKKDNPFDTPMNGALPSSKSSNDFNGPQSPTAEKRSWKTLGRKSTATSQTPNLANIQQTANSIAQTEKLPSKFGPINVENYPQQPEPDPSQPPQNTFQSIQTLFYHLSTSAPHQPLPSKKDPKKEGETAQTASLMAAPAPAPASPSTNGPQQSLTTSSNKPLTRNHDEPQGPPLLASLPPPSAPRGGGPFSGGSLGRGVVRPEDVLKTVKRENEMFRGMAQQDAHEFLGWVLNKVAEEVEPLDKHLKQVGKSAVNPATKGNGKTFVQNLFEGSLTNETRCLSCETTSSRDELFLDLSIDIEQHTSVTSCLRGFSASEMLCQKNKFYCDSCCGLQEAEKRMKIKRLPNILALHLKRFKYQETLGRYTKLFYRVPFPQQLRLPNTADDTEDPDRLYELFAVVVHIGNGPHHGHYVAIVRSGGRWIMCDDENVEPIEDSDIYRYFGDYPSGAGYVLFYQAVDLDLASLGLKVPPPPSPKSQPAPLVQPQPYTTPMNEPLIEMDEPLSPPKTLLKLDIPPSAPVMSQPVQPQVQTPTVITPSQAPASVYTNGAARSNSAERSQSITSDGKRDSKWFNRKKTDSLPIPPATSAKTSRPSTGTSMTSSQSTTFSGLGVSVPNTMHGDGAEGVQGVSNQVQQGHTPSSATVASSPSVVSSTPSSFGGVARKPSQRSSTNDAPAQRNVSQASNTSFSGGSGLSRKLSGMSTKSLMSRSGSLMKLGLGKKDKKVDEED